MRIPQNEIDRVLDATSIEDVIGDFVELKKDGSSGRLTACCPFHNERRPSFKVTPSMNMYKCFSCGAAGGPIQFLMNHEGMTFVNSIKYLAKKANISIKSDETPQTTEEIERDRKKEAARNINRAALDYFATQLTSDNERARFAREYAIKRWGEKFVKEAGIGFAPGHGSLLKWANVKGFSIDLMIELGLLRRRKDGAVYDGFYDRLMMPILSRSNQVVGFIGRVLDGSEPKYMNSPESILFHKGKNIFGINVAIRAAAREGIFYLVEGAPDVYRMQLIGAPNTVAPLGLAWSPDQLKQLLKYNASVCFIPDIDPPKEKGDKFGPGITGVMKNGRTAIEAGLRVLVKEIVPEDPSVKADTDSYIQSRAILEAIPKEDFIIWYTGKVIADKESAAEKAEVLKDVSTLLAKVDDKNYVQMLIKQVSKIIGVTVSIVQSAVNETVKGNVEKKQGTGAQLIDRELYSKYGFYEKHNCYYSLDKDGGEVRWSNFIMEPLFHIEDWLNAKRLYRIKNISGHEKIIEFKQEDLGSLQRYKTRVESIGNFVWEAKEEQLTKLKCFLYEKTETATEITQLGWQDGEFFAFGNGVIHFGQWIPADDFGIVRIKDLGNFYLPATSKIYRNERKLFQFERKFVHSALSEISFRTYTDKLIEVFGNNAKVGICFFLATLFKDVVTAKTKNFPILNLFGPKGSGKLELGHSLMSFFIINNEPPNLSSSTDAALADAVAQCANALVHIDEYKNTIELTRREFIKGLYDGVGRSRMNMDRDKKREITAVDCGVILSGQEIPTIDIAIFSRLLYLTFDRTEFGAEANRRFDELKSMRDLGCSHLVIELLRHRKRVEADFSSNYNSAFADMQGALEDKNIESRIFRNWITPLAIFRTLAGVIDVSFDYKEMLGICVDGAIRQNGVCKSTNELASFWHVVDFLHQNGDIFIDADYRIKYEKGFKGKGVNSKIEFQRARPVLYLRFKRVMMLYRKNGKTVGEPTLPAESLRHYLENSKEYLGMKSAVRFKVLSNAIEARVSTTKSDGTPTVKDTSQVDWALAFDYNMLSENYGINLEIFTDESEETDPIDFDENDNSTPY